MTDQAELPGTLKIGEFHPSAHYAMEIVKRYKHDFQLIEAIASAALSGNRTAEIVHETFRRVREGEAVSDRYLCGLAIFLIQLRDEFNE